MTSFILPYSLIVVGGAPGIGVGLGLQAIVSNFVAGLVLLLEQPIKLGDRIQIGETFGDVVRVRARSIWIRTNNDVVIIVPNSEFINKRMTNWTANDSQARITIPVGVGYGSDVKQVRDVLLDVAGRLAKSPSFWIKHVDFTRDYLRVGDFWLLSKVTAASDVHLAGTRALTIDDQNKDVEQR